MRTSRSCAPPGRCSPLRRSSGPRAASRRARHTSTSSCCTWAPPSSSAKPPEMTTSPSTPFCAHWCATAKHVAGGHRHDGEVDPPGDVEDGRLRRSSGDRQRVRVHRVHVAASRRPRRGWSRSRDRSTSRGGRRRSPQSRADAAVAGSTRLGPRRRVVRARRTTRRSRPARTRPRRPYRRRGPTGSSTPRSPACRPSGGSRAGSWHESPGHPVPRRVAPTSRGGSCRDRGPGSRRGP